MDISKYVKNPCNCFGDIISSLIVDLYNRYKYKNILFVRTSTTGGWLDRLLLEKQDINLVQSDLKKVIVCNYFPTDFFAQNLSVQGNNFAKLIMYPDSLQYGITNQVHISNFSKLNNLSMYLVIGKINLNP